MKPESDRIYKRGDILFQNEKTTTPRFDMETVMLLSYDLELGENGKIALFWKAIDQEGRLVTVEEQLFRWHFTHIDEMDDD